MISIRKKGFSSICDFLAVGGASRMSSKIRIIFFVLIFAFFTVANSRRVIYVNYGRNNTEIQHTTLRTGGIIIVPPEKKECKDQRVLDRYNKCRKIIEF